MGSSKALPQLTRSRRKRQVFQTFLKDLTETQAYRVAHQNSEHVQKKWGPILRDFEKITPQQYRRFLDFDVNQHWTTLYRQVALSLNNDNFRYALAALAADEVNVADRIDEATKVPGVGIGTASALLCTMDGRWGVWNGTTEAALKKLGLWPIFQRGLATVFLRRPDWSMSDEICKARSRL